jgi:hypothetical protein
LFGAAFLGAAFLGAAFLGAAFLGAAFARIALSRFAFIGLAPLIESVIECAILNVPILGTSPVF